MARPKGSPNKNKLQLSPDKQLSPDHVAEVKQKAKAAQSKRKPRKTETEKIENALDTIRKMMGQKRAKAAVKPSDNYDVGYKFAEPLAGKRKTAAELAKIALEKDPSRDRSIETTETYAKARLKRVKGSQ